jgi:superfamily II DNA or RNA helicase
VPFLDGDEPVAVPALLRRLRAAGHTRISRGAVERVLAGDARFAAAETLGRVGWQLAPDPPAGSEVTAGRDAPADPGRPLDGLDLRDWQINAFADWVAAGCRGVVEAITGSGKTRLAMAAVRVVHARQGRALVLVPTLDLQDQWVGELRALVPTARIGRLGGGRDDDLFSHDVLVATPHSAAAVPVDLPHGALGLLVADEAHRYGAPTWGAALRDDFAMRLALTATYERNDDGLTDVLGPYFGGVVHGYGYAQAAADRVIAPFRVALVGTDLDDGEREAWVAADGAARRARRVLVGDHRLPRNPIETIRAAAALIADADAGRRSHRDADVVAAREYLKWLRARRDVAAQAAGKLDVLRVLAPALQGRRTLVFCDTVDQAELAARRITAAGGPLAETVHGDLPGDKRRIRLAQFRNGNLPVVVAPRVLDEGVDVPDADVAVVLAAFRSRRQMVQRLGRVLRVKDDGREARLVIAYAKGTLEDPDEGAHEAFLDEILPVATAVDRLDADADPGAVVAWLA